MLSLLAECELTLPHIIPGYVQLRASKAKLTTSATTITVLRGSPFGRLKKGRKPPAQALHNFW
jgi:hypothetical protein